MRKDISQGIVVAAFLCLLGYALTALAGEVSLGSVWVADGGGVNNLMSGDGGEFTIRTPSKVSIQCDQDVYVCTDVSTCAAPPKLPGATGAGVKVLANTLFPTSVDTSVLVTSLPLYGLSDAGVSRRAGGIVTVRPVTASTVNCTYFTRKGSE